MEWCVFVNKPIKVDHQLSTDTFCKKLVVIVVFCSVEASVTVNVTVKTNTFGILENSPIYWSSCHKFNI